MAGGYFPSIKIKRKNLDDVSDDFSDFSLSSPARKIRRLDAELPPIMEEEEADIHPMVGVTSVVEGKTEGLSSLDSGWNQEKAIVLFKPVNANPFLHSPSNFSVSVDSDFFSGLKNQFLRTNGSAYIKPVEEEEATKECMAVVPWVPSNHLDAQCRNVCQTEDPELMEAEQVGEATMDIEENNDEGIEEEHGNEYSELRATQGFPQWQQQHCMIPLPPHNTSTPITWFH